MSSLFDSRQLEIFRILARNLSFTQTALAVGVSQSAVSHTLQALERQLGCRLVDRSSRRAALTPAGEHLLHHVDRILEEARTATIGLERLKKWGQVHIRVGGPPSICDLLLPPCMKELRRNYPNCSFVVETADRDRAIELLLDCQIDIAVVAGSGPDQRFDYKPLFSDELVFVMLPDHPWASNLPDDTATLAAEPLISFSRGSYSWNLILHHLRHDNLKPSILIECNSVMAMRNMVLLGLGVGVLPKVTVRDDVAAGNLVTQSIGKTPLIRRWGAIWLRSRTMPLAELQLIESMRREAIVCLDGVIPALTEASFVHG